jgi:hypothetical protein
LLELLQRIGIEPDALLWIIGVSTVVLFIAYRRFIFNIFDPLCLFLATLVADSALMLALPWAADLKWEFVGFTFFLWAGFALRGRLPAIHPKIVFSRETLFELEFVLLVLFIIIIAGNLYLGISTGFPLLSSNPSQAKVEDFTGGLGIIRRINMGPYDFFSCGCLLLAVIGYKRRLALSILCIATCFVILDGSKGVMLPIIFAVTFLLAHRGLGVSNALRMRVKKYAFLLLVLGTSIAVLIKARDTGSIYGGLLGFFQRLLLAGDVILYYFPRREVIMTFVDPNVWGYLHNLLGDPLGMLRIVEYKAALGSIILGSDEGFGPNVQYFIQADLFFGIYFGILYCFIIGYMIASLRINFFKQATNSAVWLAFKLMLAASAFSFAIDAGLFVAPIITACILVLPLWLLARLIWIGARHPLWGPVVPLYLEGAH